MPPFFKLTYASFPPDNADEHLDTGYSSASSLRHLGPVAMTMTTAMTPAAANTLSDVIMLDDLTDDVTIAGDQNQMQPLAGSVIAVVVLGCASFVAALLYAYLYYFLFKPGDRSSEAARQAGGTGRGGAHARWSVVHGVGHDSGHRTSSASAGSHGGAGGRTVGAGTVGSRGRATHLLMFKKS